MMHPAASGPVALVIAAAVLAGAAVSAIRTVATYHGGIGDYTQDYLAGRAVLAGRPVYAPIPEDPAVAPVFGRPGGVVNDHPPTYIVALSSLSVLPYRWAAAALGFASIAAVSAAGWVAGGEFGLPPAGRLMLAAVLLWLPVTEAGLSLGTLSLLLLGAVVGGWAAARREADAAAGVLLGTAAAVKLFPGLLVVGLWAAGQRRAAGIAAGVAVALTAGTVAAVGVSTQVDYFTRRSVENAKAMVDHPYNLSWGTTVCRAFALVRVEEADGPSPPSAARTATILGGHVLLVAIPLLAIRLGPAANRTPDLTFAALIPAMLLASPVTWGHALPMAVIPIGVLALSRLVPAETMVLVAATAVLFIPGMTAWEWVTGAVAGGPAERLPELAHRAGLLGLLGLATARLLRRSE